MSLGLVLSSEDARTLTDQIKVAVEGVWHLIERAYTARAWTALGYRSWDDYCTREFGTARLRLPREERQEVVASLRQSGLSLRAISSATGHDTKTIQSDLRRAQVSEIPTPDEPSPVTGIDGKTYTPRVIEREYVDTSTGEITETRPVAAPRVNVPKTTQAVIGLALDAAEKADQLRPSHFADKKDEAAVWHRSLVNSIQSLQRLADTLEGASK